MYTLTHPQQCPLLTVLSQNLIVIIPAAPHCVCTTSATASPPQKPQWGTQTHIYGATVSPHHLWLHVERANHFTAPGGKQSCLSLWTNSFKLLQDFFFLHRSSAGLLKAQNWRQVHICYIQPVLDLCLYITSTNISPHDNISASFREKWVNGASL